MNGIPADLLIYIIIAIGLVFWLRNTIGTRHGDERQRPNPFADTKDNSSGSIVDILDKIEPHVVPLPKNMIFTDSEAESGVRDIMQADSHFDPAEFVENAKDAFVMVVEGFADGDRDILQALLSEPVYKGFDEAISAREKAGETVETEIHAIKKAEIVDAGLRDKMIFVSFQFTAEETAVIRDKDSNILSGDPDRITQMCDIWTFGRNLKDKDPTWQVYETRDGEPEDHKTPIPDAG